jgi:FkbM family methyltransferase
MNKLIKLFKLFKSVNFINGLRFGVAATTEHIPVLMSLNNVNTIIDIGANKGQFTLAARYVYSKSRIISFEPLIEPAETFWSLFKSDKNIYFYNSAIGPEKKTVPIHVSQRGDSSSKLQIGIKQSMIFPGTEESHTEDVSVAPLNHYVRFEDLVSPILLKIDVQGYELEVLKGCGDFLAKFDYIYIECSFVKLYKEQVLVDEVIQYLINYSFKLNGIYNIFYDKKGIAVQGDFLFSKIRSINYR